MIHYSWFRYNSFRFHKPSFWMIATHLLLRFQHYTMCHAFMLSFVNRPPPPKFILIEANSLGLGTCTSKPPFLPPSSRMLCHLLYIVVPLKFRHNFFKKNNC